MIILLYGQNNYRLKRKLKEIIDRYRQKHPRVNLSRIDAEQLDFADFWREFQQKSIFVSRRLIIIDNIFLGRDFKKQFKKQLKKLMADEDILVAWSATEPKKEDQLLVERIKKGGQVQKFPQPKRSDTRRWLEEFDQQLDLSGEAKERLIDYIQDDWIRGQAAISRLILTNDRSSEIARLDRMREQTEEINLFSLTEAIAQGSKEKALMMVHRYFSQKGRPERLLPIVVYQFRQLLLVRDLIERGQDYHQIKRSAKIPPFVLGRIYQPAQNVSLNGLKKVYRQLFALDYQIKTGQVDFRTGFDLFIARV